MTTFRVNLIRDLVPGFKKRRSLFWMMHLYILVAGAMLVYVAFIGTCDVASMQRVLKDSRLVERDFLARYEPDRGMVPYLYKLSEDVSLQAEMLSMLQSTLDQRLLVSAVLAGLALPLKNGMAITRFELKGGGSFELDISCDQHDGERIDSSMPITAWQADAKLSSIMENIKPALVQRQLIEAKKQILLKYEGKIKPGAL